MNLEERQADYEALLSERFSAKPDPKNGGACIPAERHVEMAGQLRERGYLIYGYCVASHWPEAKDEPEHYELAYALRAEFWRRLAASTAV